MIFSTQIFFSLIFSTLGIFTLYSIIWFERFGSDLKRMFINKTIMSVFWSILAWIVFAQIPDMIRYFSKPFSDTFCFVYLLLKNAIVMQILLFFDAHNLVRYLFIFWLKNPYNFQDDFWYLCVNIWIVAFSLAGQFVFLYLPGHQPLNYYICTGKLPDSRASIHTSPNYITIAVQLLSVTLYIFVSVRIRFYKRKESFNIETRNITDYVTAFSNFTMTCVVTSVMVFFNGIKPEKANEYHLFIYFYHMIEPLLIAFLMSSMYFIRQPMLRKTMFREGMNFIETTFSKK